ncbi:MAG: hypothetical protein KF768_14060 [Phycisphaeraceae bacterium]|nr:hypothetical protein [Phycisphaeraceae bacterium]
MTNARDNKNLPETPVADCYAARRNDIARLLDVLAMELDRHDEKAAAEPGNWGFAGNLGKVREDLINLVGFMSNRDPHEIEAFLNDAE